MIIITSIKFVLGSSEKGIGVRWNYGIVERWKNGMMGRWNAGKPSIPIFQYSRITMHYP
ncbi:MAG: hypothetical protein IIB05_07445 [Bacteroidetes bacterium]|nr:hypothetical protein [Bacteroidota bacterium]